MDRSQAFLLGFLLAGLVGWFSSQIWQGWVIITGVQRRIFSPPNPALRPIPESPNKSIGTDPEQSPIQVLSQGCSAIIQQLLLQVVLFALIALILWFNLDEDALRTATIPEFLIGSVAFAPALSILLRLIYRNWSEIQNLYNRMLNPPSPSLSRATPPNNHYVSARPAISAYEAVISGTLEIIGRLILQIFLFGALFLLLRAVYVYLSD